VIERLGRLGYDHEGDLGVPGRDAFAAAPASPPHHLYVCPVDSPALTRHLALRDLLRADPGAAAAYAGLKRSLAVRFRHDRVAYTDAKTAFIDALLTSRRQGTILSIRIASDSNLS
jgi:GrpB-like predicted nucleotidyltransferase (UPF0157 family)